jgi:hypothetical protein
MTRTLRTVGWVSFVLLQYVAQGQATRGAASMLAKSKALQDWTYTFTLDGYLARGSTSFATPILTADHNWLHLEGRYDYEDLHTGSLWAGYNFGKGDVQKDSRWELDVTPLIGGVFGRTTGIAPGCEVELDYGRKWSAYLENEYVFDTTSKSGDFYYAWPQIAFSPVTWLRVGGVAQHTVAYSSRPTIQGGFLVGFGREKWQFTSYVFSPGGAGTTVVLESIIKF